MTEKEVNEYLVHGWLLVRKALPELDLTRLVESLALEWPQQGAVGNRRYQAHINHPELLQVLTGPGFALYAKSALAAEPVLYWSSLFQFSSEMGPHVDQEYIQTEPLGQSVGLWLALETIDKNNGGLWLASGSHMWSEEKRKRYIQQETDFESCEIPVLQAGDLLVLNSSMIHGACPVVNKSTERKSLVAHYLSEQAKLNPTAIAEEVIQSKSKGAEINYLDFKSVDPKNRS